MRNIGLRFAALAAGLFLALGLAALGAGAQADELTFTGGTLTEVGTSSNFPNYTYTYTEGPMLMTLEESYPISQCYYTPCFTSFNLGSDEIPGLQVGLYAVIYFTLIDGGAFDVSDFAFSGGGDTVITGYLGDENVGGILLYGGGGIATPPSTWDDVTELEWCSFCESDFQPNNDIGALNYAPLPLASVPEPGSLALLGSGLFGLGALRRRLGGTRGRNRKARPIAPFWFTLPGKAPRVL